MDEKKIWSWIMMVPLIVAGVWVIYSLVVDESLTTIAIYVLIAFLLAIYSYGIYVVIVKKEK